MGFFMDNSSAWPYRLHWILEIFFGIGAAAPGKHLVSEIQHQKETWKGKR